MIKALSKAVVVIACAVCSRIAFENQHIRIIEPSDSTARIPLLLLPAINLASA